MPGVMFDEASAKRIADGTRKIERIPGGEQDLQRRRAGGLGRSTLWEVTAVQTGPGTVTIKRVSNIAFDLNDPSEKTDILYDPNNEPSTGDRGLLIRLGEGNLFFFRREAGTNKIYVDEMSYIDEAVPASTFGYPNDAIISGEQGASKDKIAILKFKERLPDPPSPSSSYRFGVAIGRLKPGGRDIKIADISVSWSMRLVVYAITDDFDPSTITYNDWAGLGKLEIISLSTPIWAVSSVQNPNADLVMRFLFEHDILFEASGGLGAYSNNAYGLGIEPFLVGEDGNSFSFPITFTSPIFGSWVEWEAL